MRTQDRGKLGKITASQVNALGYNCWKVRNNPSYSTELRQLGHERLWPGGLAYDPAKKQCCPSNWISRSHLFGVYPSEMFVNRLHGKDELTSGFAVTVPEQPPRPVLHRREGQPASLATTLQAVEDAHGGNGHLTTRVTVWHVLERIAKDRGVDLGDAARFGVGEDVYGRMLDRLEKEQKAYEEGKKRYAVKKPRAPVKICWGELKLADKKLKLKDAQRTYEQLGDEQKGVYEERSREEQREWDTYRLTV